jgi:stalled ribosome rescue protein Dom34
MKIIKKPKIFQPITIVLETEDELFDLKTVLQYGKRLT